MKIQLRKRLGDLLVEEGIVSEDQIQQALTSQRSTGQKLGATNSKENITNVNTIKEIRRKKLILCKTRA